MRDSKLIRLVLKTPDEGAQVEAWSAVLPRSTNHEPARRVCACLAAQRYPLPLWHRFVRVTPRDFSDLVDGADAAGDHSIAPLRRPPQLVEGDGRRARAFRSRDRPRWDRCGTPTMPTSPHPDAERIDDVVLLVDEDHLDVLHVGVHRHVVLSAMLAFMTTEPVIDHRPSQRH